MATVESAVYRCTVCHAVYTKGERFCPLDAAPVAAEDRHSDPRVGRTIDGRYFVRRLIGRGGMGAVYEADHVGLDKRVAIKFLSTNLTDRESLARFRREAKVASKIVHEHVVQIFDVGTADADADFIVMELIEGKDLAGVLRDGGPLDARRTVSIIRKVLRGLRAIHQAGIVHRDIKPANILLSPRDDDQDFVKIMDFGISKSITGADALTNTGAIIGTPEYMAPEQLLADTIDHRADLYAVGLMAFRMLTGTMPFTKENTFDRSAAANPYVEVPKLAALRPDIPTDLSDVLAKALAKEPDNRYPDAAAFVAALENLGSPSLAPSLPPLAAVPPLAALPPRPVVVAKSAITGTEQTISAEAGTADTAIASLAQLATPTVAMPTLTEPVRRSNKTVFVALGALAIVAAAVVVVMVMRGSGDKAASQGNDPNASAPAAPPAPSLPAGAPPTKAPPTAPTAKDKAAAHLMKAREAEAAGKYEDQLKELLAAYAIDPASSTTFEIAETHERLKHTQDAIHYFERYLNMEMHATNADLVRARIKKLEGWLAAELKEIGTKKAGGPTGHDASKPPNPSPPTSKKACHCIANTRERRNSMSLCKTAEPLKCRCQSNGRSLCKVDTAADAKCPDPTFNKYALPGKPDEPCRGYVAGDPQDVEGKWDCNACPNSSTFEHHGENGEACVGYYLDNGQRETKAVLMDCH